MSALQQSNEFPTLREELSRKALETIEKIALDDKVGRINRAQYAYAVDVLWSALAGLVDDDFRQIIEIMGEVKPDASIFTRTYMRDAHGNIAVVTNLHDGRVRLQTHPLNGVATVTKMFDFRQNVGSHREAKEKYETLIDALVARGFEEI